MNICPVSVIIPCYNREEYLGRAINSVMRQSLPCLEIIVIDDGSTDASSTVAQQFAANSEKIPIRYFYQSNAGPAGARNTGILKSSAPFLAFLDSDDHWHKRKLQEQFSQMVEQQSYLISHTGEKWLRCGKHLNQKKIHRPRHGDIFSHCLQLCAVGMSTVMAKRELFDHVGLSDASLPCCEDYDFWLRVSCRHSFLLVEQPLTIKEGGRCDQVSYKFRVGMDRYRIKSLERLIQSGVLNDSQRFFAIQELTRKIQIFAQGCIKHGNEATGRKYLKKLESLPVEEPYDPG